MSDTYICPSDWLAGCDDCGDYKSFDEETDAQQWADKHTCSEQEES
jgi:hypothetical protein